MMNVIDKTDKSLENQAYQLILKYTSNNKVLMYNFYNSSYDGRDSFFNFVNNAYVYILDHKYLDRYNAERSKLSTYIYTIMKCLTPLFLTQTIYNVSSNTARLMLTERNNIGNIVKSIYQNNNYIDTLDSKINVASSGSSSRDEDEVCFIDSSLADYDSDPYYQMIENNQKYYIEALDNAIVRYCNKQNNKDNIERNIDILRKYLIYNNYSNFGNSEKFTLEVLAKNYGLTRQGVQQIIQRFRNWVITCDSTIKNLITNYKKEVL